MLSEQEMVTAIIKRLDDHWREEKPETIKEVHRLLCEKEEKVNPLNVQVQRMYRFETDRPLKAFVDIIVEDCLLIKGVRIMDGKQGLFVSMPREQASDKKWYDTIRCLTPEVRDQIQDVVIACYKEDGEEGRK